uniref:Uncharacterized protein n=1 Tax=Anguilla anguilla TaxID=7936 RepID=A0A0E9QEE1_ANGAN
MANISPDFTIHTFNKAVVFVTRKVWFAYLTYICV